MELEKRETLTQNDFVSSCSHSFILIYIFWCSIILMFSGNVDYKFSNSIKQLIGLTKNNHYSENF